MTDTGYKMLIDRITNRPVNPPENLNVNTLTIWVDGYLQSEHDVLDIIEEMQKGPLG